MLASLFWSLRDAPPFSVQRQERIKCTIVQFIVAILSLKSVEIKIKRKGKVWVLKMLTHLPITSIALLEVLVAEQISCECSHGLDVPGCDFIQILKLL